MVGFLLRTSQRHCSTEQNCLSTYFDSFVRILQGFVLNHHEPTRFIGPESAFLQHSAHSLSLLCAFLRALKRSGRISDEAISPASAYRSTVPYGGLGCTRIEVVNVSSELSIPTQAQLLNREFLVSILEASSVDKCACSEKAYDSRASGSWVLEPQQAETHLERVQTRKRTDHQPSPPPRSFRSKQCVTVTG